MLFESLKNLSFSSGYNNSNKTNSISDLNNSSTLEFGNNQNSGVSYFIPQNGKTSKRVLRRPYYP